MKVISLGYRLRWLYVLLFLALAWLWWAVYLEGHVLPWAWACNARFLFVTQAYWTTHQGDAWFGYLGGAFGLGFSPTYGGSGGFPLWSRGLALALILLWLTLVPLFLGLRGRTRQRWPARTPLHVGAIVAAAIMAGFLSTGAIALGLVAYRPDMWLQFISLPFRLPALQPLAQTGPSPVALSVAAAVPVTLTVAMTGAWAAGLAWSRRQQTVGYWRLERVTRWLAIAAIALWLGRWIVPQFGSIQPGPGWGVPAMTQALHTASFAATSVLVWVAAVRTWLLFRYRAFEQAETEPVCFACGYDLRGSIPAGATHCPECGMRISAELLAKAGEPVSTT